MEYEDQNFDLRIWHTISIDGCLVEVIGEEEPSVDITEGTYYFINSDESDKLSNYQLDFIGKVYNYYDDYAQRFDDEEGKAHTFTVVSCDEKGLITKAKLDGNEFSLTDRSVAIGSLVDTDNVFSYRGSFDNVNVQMEYSDKDDYFSLDFSYAPQDAPSFETIDGSFKIIQ
jgi:hypothetical protein